LILIVKEILFFIKAKAIRQSLGAGWTNHKVLIITLLILLDHVLTLLVLTKKILLYYSWQI